MFTFYESEIIDISRNNDLKEFLRDVERCGVLTEEDKRFIGFYALQTPYSKGFTEVQRFRYLTQLNTALKLRASLPVYSVIVRDL